MEGPSRRWWTASLTSKGGVGVVVGGRKKQSELLRRRLWSAGDISRIVLSRFYQVRLSEYRHAAIAAEMWGRRSDAASFMFALNMSDRKRWFSFADSAWLPDTHEAKRWSCTQPLLSCLLIWDTWRGFLWVYLSLERSYSLLHSRVPPFC